jgi:hypothetical protein
MEGNAMTDPLPLTVDQLKAENARLVAENATLTAKLAEAEKAKPAPGTPTPKGGYWGSKK